MDQKKLFDIDSYSWCIPELKTPSLLQNSNIFKGFYNGTLQREEKR